VPITIDDQRQAVRALARIARLLERASGELSLAHYRVLSAVAAGDERASRLAVRLSIGKPSVSAAVESLSQRGLLTRSSVEGDQRATTLALTPAGRQQLAETETAMLRATAEVWDRCADPAAIIAALAQTGAALDELGAQRLAARRSGAPA
jgi:DNA-binding MarR family transcriptional regulator